MLARLVRACLEPRELRVYVEGEPDPIVEYTAPPGRTGAADVLGDWMAERGKVGRVVSWERCIVSPWGGLRVALAMFPLAT
jgi:hypothetical protein